MQVFKDALLMSTPHLFGLVLMMTIAAILFSSLVFFAEQTHPDPAQRADFDNIPSTIWWAFVTMTTVGYGKFVCR